ncbi:hypothetical protein MMC18_002291 [Xylographa bjoerkii]|nr:hypothetical protein [Xylographa bjoerkii]
MAAEKSGMAIESVDTASEGPNTAEAASATSSKAPNTLLSIPQEIRHQINFHTSNPEGLSPDVQRGKEDYVRTRRNLFVILKFHGELAWIDSRPFRSIPAIWDQGFKNLPAAALAISIRNIDEDWGHPDFERSVTMITAIQSLDAIMGCFWQIGSDRWTFEGYDSWTLRFGCWNGQQKPSLSAFSMDTEHKDSAEVADNGTEDVPSSALQVDEQATDSVDLVHDAIDSHPNSASESSNQARNFADSIHEAIQRLPTLASYLGVIEEMFAGGNEALQSGRCHEAQDK